MIVQFRNEKVSNHSSIPITIDCNVVAFIVFEEGFHQPIKRTKQRLELGRKNELCLADAVGMARSVKAVESIPEHGRHHPGQDRSHVTTANNGLRGGLMAWVGFITGGKSDLHRIRNVKLTAKKYADKILRLHVVPYAATFGYFFR
ncbi:hypothetical protein TNCV_1934731 [Trichonephila clavipes]|nr:hypothetical protein TNCV_1934731 [Trichonephila clavipes]